MSNTTQTIELSNGENKVIECLTCKKKMVNLDFDEIKSGDLTKLKKEKILISNPDTTKPYCVECEYVSGWGKFVSWMTEDTDDDDSSFFSSSGSFRGGGGFGGFGGGFGGGGFGGGGFGGGGCGGGF